MKVTSNKLETDMVHGPETKPRTKPGGSADCDYTVKKCSSGGDYQELPALGAFPEVVDGSRSQRLHGRCYHKTELAKKEGILDGMLKPDTHGPPYENISTPKRIL